MNKAFMLRKAVERMKLSDKIFRVNGTTFHYDDHENYCLSGSVVDDKHGHYTGELFMNVKMWIVNIKEEYVDSVYSYSNDTDEEYSEEHIQALIDDEYLYEEYIEMCTNYEEYDIVRECFYMNGIRNYGALDYVKKEFEEKIVEYGIDDKNGEYKQYTKYILTSDGDGRDLLYTLDFDIIYVKQYYYEVLKVSNGGSTRYVNIYNNDEKYNEEISRINETKLSESKNEKLNGTLILHGSGLDVVSYELMTYYKNLYPKLSLVDVQELYTIIKEE